MGSGVEVGVGVGGGVVKSRGKLSREKTDKSLTPSMGQIQSKSIKTTRRVQFSIWYKGGKNTEKDPKKHERGVLGRGLR